MVKKGPQTIFLLVLCSIALFFCLSAITTGIFAILPAVFLIVVISYLLLPEHKQKQLLEKKWFGVLYKMVTNIIAIGIAVCVTSLVMMLIYASEDKDVPENSTVIVMGAQVKEGRPSESLKRRLDKAVEYLNEHKDAPVIVTGAKGAKEMYSEASVMKKYLIEKGIDSDRIYVDDKARNSLENIENSKAIIEENNLSTDVVVATEWYHQLRSRRIAQNRGLQTHACTATTPWYIVEAMFVRESLAIVKCLILGF